MRTAAPMPKSECGGWPSCELYRPVGPFWDPCPVPSPPLRVRRQPATALRK